MNKIFYNEKFLSKNEINELTNIDKEHITLGQDQIKWLNKYGKIKLNQWRVIVINKNPEWLYVGEWRPGPIKPYPSRLDGGYKKRQKNLEYNRYCYWPSENNEKIKFESNLEEVIDSDDDNSDIELIDDKYVLKFENLHKNKSKRNIISPLDI